MLLDEPHGTLPIDSEPGTDERDARSEETAPPTQEAAATVFEALTTEAPSNDEVQEPEAREPEANEDALALSETADARAADVESSPPISTSIVVADTGGDDRALSEPGCGANDALPVRDVAAGEQTTAAVVSDATPSNTEASAEEPPARRRQSKKPLVSIPEEFKGWTLEQVVARYTEVMGRPPRSSTHIPYLCWAIRRAEHGYVSPGERGSLVRGLVLRAPREGMKALEEVCDRHDFTSTEEFLRRATSELLARLDESQAAEHFTEIRAPAAHTRRMASARTSPQS